jgi:hypothetical protein
MAPDVSDYPLRPTLYTLPRSSYLIVSSLSVFKGETKPCVGNSDRLVRCLKRFLDIPGQDAHAALSRPFPDTYAQIVTALNGSGVARPTRAWAPRQVPLNVMVCDFISIKGTSRL